MLSAIWKPPVAGPRDREGALDEKDHDRRRGGDRAGAAVGRLWRRRRHPGRERTGTGTTPITYGIPSPLATEPGEHNINLGITCYAEKTGGKVITLDSNST